MFVARDQVFWKLVGAAKDELVSGLSQTSKRFRSSIDGIRRRGSTHEEDGEESYGAVEMAHQIPEQMFTSPMYAHKVPKDGAAP